MDKVYNIVKSNITESIAFWVCLFIIRYAGLVALIVQTNFVFHINSMNV